MSVVKPKSSNESDQSQRTLNTQLNQLELVANICKCHQAQETFVFVCLFFLEGRGGLLPIGEESGAIFFFTLQCNNNKYFNSPNS